MKNTIQSLSGPTSSNTKKTENLLKRKRNKKLEESGVGVKTCCQGLGYGEDGDGGSAYAN